MLIYMIILCAIVMITYLIQFKAYRLFSLSYRSGFT
jgi:hypothetical protein